MVSLWEFLTGNLAQRMAISASMYALCWSMGVTQESLTPWLIIILYWAGSWLAYNEGVFRGALGFHRLPERDKARAIELFNSIEKDDNQ